MEAAAARAKQAGLLWLAGFREACSFHRVVVPCLRSRKLMIRMGQCFLLHGFILLGSLFMLNSVVIPILLWILPGNCEQIDLRYLCDHESVLGLYSFLRSILIQLFYILWFYPLYIFSFIVTIIWYSDIAKHGFDAVTRKRSHLGQSLSMTDIPDSKHTPDGGKPGGVEGVVLGFGEHAYSLLLLTIFLIEVFVTKYIPYIGKGLNFLLLSWINSYYCFEYKWNLSELSLDKRLDFFESNWAFFAGFGSPCALAIFFFSPLVSCGVMGILFPLFVLTAAGTQEEEVTDSQKRLWGGEGLQRIRILYFADILSFELIGQQPLGGLVAQLVLKLMSKNSIHAVAVMILLIWGGSPFEVLFSPGCGYCNGFPRAVKVTDKVKHPWSRTYFPVNLVALSYAKEHEIDASSPCSSASGLGYL